MRYKGFNGPLHVSQEMLTYGRLLERGDDDDLVRQQVTTGRDWEWDVAYVGHRTVEHVVMRSFYLDALHDICDRRHWSLLETDDVPYGELESVLTKVKVTFNHSLGSQLNCRVYEAFACGSALVTDFHNADNGRIKNFARFYANRDTLEVALDYLIVGGGFADRRVADESVRPIYTVPAQHWVIDHSPRRTWERNFDACELLASQVRSASRPATVPGFTSQVLPPLTLATCRTPASCE